MLSSSFFVFFICTELSLKTHHDKLVVLVKQRGEGEGGDDGGAEREVRVEHGAVLGLPVRGRGAVEAGPEHPEEDGAHHGEEVGVVAGALLLVVHGRLGVHHPGWEEEGA